MWFLGVFENRIYQQILAISLDLGYPNHINFCVWFCDLLFFLFRWTFPWWYCDHWFIGFVTLRFILVMEICPFMDDGWRFTYQTWWFSSLLHNRCPEGTILVVSIIWDLNSNDPGQQLWLDVSVIKVPCRLEKKSLLLIFMSWIATCRKHRIHFFGVWIWGITRFYDHLSFFIGHVWKCDDWPGDLGRVISHSVRSTKSAGPSESWSLSGGWSKAECEPRHDSELRNPLTITNEYHIWTSHMIIRYY